MVNTVTAASESDVLVEKQAEKESFNLSYTRDKKQLQEMYGWTREQIDIIMEKHNKDIGAVLIAINDILGEYNEFGITGPWEKPTNDNLFTILSSAEEYKADPFTIQQ